MTGDLLLSTVDYQADACRICTGCAQNRPAGECRLTVRCPVDGRTKPCRYAPKVAPPSHQADAKDCR